MTEEDRLRVLTAAASAYQRFIRAPKGRTKQELLQDLDRKLKPVLREMAYEYALIEIAAIVTAPEVASNEEE